MWRRVAFIRNAQEVERGFARTLANDRQTLLNLA